MANWKLKVGMLFDSKEFEQGVQRIDKQLNGTEAQEIIKVIDSYSNALNLLDDYDHRKILKPDGTTNNNSGSTPTRPSTGNRPSTGIVRPGIVRPGTGSNSDSGSSSDSTVIN